MNHCLLASLLVFSSSLLGCSDDAPAGDSGADASTDTSTGDTSVRDTSVPDTTAGDGGDGCTITGLTLEGPVIAEQDTEFLFFGAASVDTFPTDFLSIDLEYTEGADNGPHTFTFTGENYDSCHTCLLIDADCDAAEFCGQSFLVESGTMDVTENGGTGGTFTAELADLRLIEVDVDDATYRSTPVVGGDVWCIEFLDVTGTTVAPTTP